MAVSRAAPRSARHAENLASRSCRFDRAVLLVALRGRIAARITNLPGVSAPQRVLLPTSDVTGARRVCCCNRIPHLVRSTVATHHYMGEC